MAKAANVYAQQLLKEVNEEREKLVELPIEEEEGDGLSRGGIVEKTVSTTDSDCRMFVKGAHERQFAYEAHTACDKKGFVLGMEITAGNAHDGVVWDALHEQVMASVLKAGVHGSDGALRKTEHMLCAKKPLRGALLMPKTNMGYVIHTAEVWSGFPLG